MPKLAHRFVLPVALATLLALPLAGCGGGGEGNRCEDLGKHVLEQLEKERKEHKELDKERERMAEATARPYVDRLVSECRDQEWSEELRSCFLKASTQEDFNRCRNLLDGEARPRSEAGGEAPPQPE